MSIQWNAFDPQDFLENFWQKRPCLIRNGLKGFKSILSPDELAGLACEEDVESRVITGDCLQNNWDLQNGPFTEDYFASFPEKNSTLLVQKVDTLIPEIADMRSLFSFIPAWRFDDVMISFAEDQGSVGPHIDNYDVFLLQGLGQRRWQVGKEPIQEEEDLLPDCPVRVLREFTPGFDWILESGDILYIPPRWAHHGVSLGRGMTYSFGFRSPAVSDMLLMQAEQSLQGLTEKDRYIDPDLRISDTPSKIDEQLVARFKLQMIEAIQRDSNAQSWIGRLITSSSLDNEELAGFEEYSLENIYELLELKDGCVERADEVKLAYFSSDMRIVAYIHGNEYMLNPESKLFIEILFAKERVSLVDLRRGFAQDPSSLEALAQWVHKGYFRILT